MAIFISALSRLAAFSPSYFSSRSSIRMCSGNSGLASAAASLGRPLAQKSKKLKKLSKAAVDCVALAMVGPKVTVSRAQGVVLDVNIALKNAATNRDEFFIIQLLRKSQKYLCFSRYVIFLSYVHRSSM